jgi:hypothetical protein
MKAASSARAPIGTYRDCAGVTGFSFPSAAHKFFESWGILQCFNNYAHIYLVTKN